MYQTAKEVDEYTSIYEYMNRLSKLIQAIDT